MYNQPFYRLLIFSLLISIDSLHSNEIEINKQRILPNIRKTEKSTRRVSFTGSIRLPEDFDCSYIYVCYNGKLIKIKNEDFSSFFIKDFDHNQVFMLFASPDSLISKTEEDNTLYNFKLKKNSFYKFYKLAKINSTNESTWNIETSELQKQNNSLEIPLNTFIILIDPKSISFSLENKSWKKESSIVELPKILIHSISDKSKFEKSCLSFMDIKPFHIEQDTKEMVKGNVKICMLL